MLEIENKDVILVINGITYKGEILRDQGLNKWFFRCFGSRNDAPFHNLNLNSYNICKQVLGYYNPGGIFPWCNTKEDVIRILQFLNNLNNDFIFLGNFVNLF